MSTERRARARETLAHFMQKTGKRNTRQRDAIVDVFLMAEDHITLQDLLTKVQEVESGVGFATVYRTMKLLTQAGIAHEHRFGEGQTRYELADLGDEHHDHLICVQCGRVEEFHDAEIEARQVAVAAGFGWRESHHVHEIYGVCPQCQAKEPRAADSA